MRRRILALLSALVTWQSALLLGQHAHTTFDATWFVLANELVGGDLVWDMKNNLRNKLGNGFQINRCSISAPMKRFVVSNRLGFMNFMPASTKILKKHGGFPDTTEAYIGSQVKEMQKLTFALGNHKVWWNLMPEYEGGYWGEGRTLDYSNRLSAYESWKNDYLYNWHPLGTYLRQSRQQRGVNIVLVNALSFSTHYSYELGADMCVLERNNDDIGDIQTGISFVRGASRQYDKPWGIDISHWRRASESGTEFDNNLQLTGGWSPSYIRRHMYIAYMSGANILLMEGAVYYNNNRLNPFGSTIKEFADFSLVRHPQIGRPAVHAALMMDFHHGFEPKYGRCQQGNSVWYAHIPYDDGDFMTHNFLDMLYPEYWKTGTLPKGAPKTPEAYRRALRKGADPQPWEPMGQSRWGDQFDVILSNASPKALRNYKTIFLIGNVRLSPVLKTKLQAWVSEGGTLLVNVRQVTAADEDFLGVRLTGSIRSATRSYWFADSTTYSELTYRYEIVRPLSAESIARNEGGDPLITRRQVDSGEVLLATAHYLQDAKMECVLKIGQKLVDALVERHADASVSGPFMVEYIVNKDSGKTVVTVVNNSGSNWNGSVIVNGDKSGITTKEWLSDSTVNHTHMSGKTIIPSFVPAYDLRIWALETSKPSKKNKNFR